MKFAKLMLGRKELKSERRKVLASRQPGFTDKKKWVYLGGLRRGKEESKEKCFEMVTESWGTKRERFIKWVIPVLAFLVLAAAANARISALSSTRA